jgi:hypothetical protein
MLRGASILKENAGSVYVAFIGHCGTDDAVVPPFVDAWNGCCLALSQFVREISARDIPLIHYPVRSHVMAREIQSSVSFAAASNGSL